MLIIIYMCESLGNKKQVDVLYFDYSKAFDRVDHTVITKKLDFLGLSKNLTTLISSYFSKSSLFLHYNGCKSSSFLQHSDVPQGSVVRSLFFISHINDLKSKLQVPDLFYADDLKIYHRIDTWEDCLKLQ